MKRDACGDDSALARRRRFTRGRVPCARTEPTKCPDEGARKARPYVRRRVDNLSRRAGDGRALELGGVFFHRGEGDEELPAIGGAAEVEAGAAGLVFAPVGERDGSLGLADFLMGHDFGLKGNVVGDEEGDQALGAAVRSNCRGRQRSEERGGGGARLGIESEQGLNQLGPAAVGGPEKGSHGVGGR